VTPVTREIVFSSNYECFEWTLTFVFGFYTLVVLERTNYKKIHLNIFQFHELHFTCFAVIHSLILETQFTFIPWFPSICLAMSSVNYILNYHWSLKNAIFKPNKTLVTNIDTIMNDGMVKLMLRRQLCDIIILGVITRQTGNRWFEENNEIK